MATIELTDTSRERRINFYLPVTQQSPPVHGKQITHVRVSCWYEIGTHNIRRSYQANVTPISRTRQENGIVIESFLAGKGSRARLEESQRFSQKQLDYWHDWVRRNLENETDLIWQMVEELLADEQLTLAEVVEPNPF